jgi:hypothetical protein
MFSNLIKISICATSLVVISALGQHPLIAQTLTQSDLDQSEVTEDGTESEEINSSLVIEQPVARSDAPVTSYMGEHKNTFTEINSNPPRRRKIPEPSAMIGLMAIAGWIGMQQHKIRKIKKG